MFSIRTSLRSKSWIATFLLIALFTIATPCHADLRSAPGWFDVNGTGAAPDWHYRVPIAIPSGAAANSTIRVDVDFSALLANLGITGTLDSASPRVVRSNGALADVQQFTDAIYAGATDALGNARGEVRFILQDPGPDAYQLYFDIIQNGVKPPWPAANTINGNFEFGTPGQSDPAGWTAAADPGFDAQVRPAETPSINSDTTGADTAFVTTDGTPHSGRYAYLLGARSQNEPGDAIPAVTLSRTIDVASVNPGTLTLRYRLEGWDSSSDGASQYDFIRMRLSGSSTVELVGPTAGNYGTMPFAPNYGVNAADATQSGYGQYNGWDTDTSGSHHYTPAMTLNPGDQPWFTVSASLSAFAGQTVTLEITSSHYNLYRSWCHLDDVEWSVFAGTLGSPQAFGADVVAPASAYAGAALAITARVDAQAAAVTAVVRDDGGAVAASGIVLYDDGTHGDPTANDGQWSNDGSDAGSPTFTIPAGTAIGSLWSVTIAALDASTTAIDTQGVTIVQPGADLSTSTKSGLDLNGGSLYPGDVLRYTITLIEAAGLPATGVRVSDVISAHLAGFSVVSLPAGATDASTPDGSGPNGAGFLDITGIDLAPGGSATIVFEASVAPSAPPGTAIDNTATVILNGIAAASPQAATLTVASPPASGTKQLYLASRDDLSRVPPNNGVFQRISPNNTHNWTLTPQLAKPFSIDPGQNVVVTLLLRSDGGWGAVTLDLELAATGTTTGTIGTLVGQSLFVTNTIQAHTFTFAPSGLTTLAAGSALRLTIRNAPQSWWDNRNFRVYTLSGGDISQVALATDTVINVDSVAFYDAAHPGGVPVASALPGGTVYVRATVSDPFGSFDITGASVDIAGPAGTSSHAMTQVLDDGAASKTYEYRLDLPPVGSDGTWTALVAATEGTEGTIIHQGTASLVVGAPLLTVLKSASASSANPGDLITYTVQVVNTGTGAALTIELDDAMSPYTALRIAYDGSDPLPFRLVTAPAGLTLGMPVYSDDGGATYGYSPLVSGGGGAPAGYDANVAHWRMPLNGSLAGSGTGFTLRYQVIVK